MKSERGVTLTTIMIYVVVMVLVVGVVTSITAFFYSNTQNMESMSNVMGEYNKFNLYFLGEVKEAQNTVISPVKDAGDASKITFSNGITYTFLGDGIYRDKVKLCTNVQDCKFSVIEDKGKQIVTVYLEMGKNDEFAKTTEYVVIGK